MASVFIWGPPWSKTVCFFHGDPLQVSNHPTAPRYSLDLKSSDCSTVLPRCLNGPSNTPPSCTPFVLIHWTYSRFVLQKVDTTHIFSCWRLDADIPISSANIHYTPYILKRLVEQSDSAFVHLLKDKIAICSLSVDNSNIIVNQQWYANRSAISSPLSISLTNSYSPAFSRFLNWLSNIRA